MTNRTGALLILIAACMACAQGSVEEGWSVGGDPAPDVPWRGHDGSFLAMLVVTDDPEAIYGFWNSQSGDVPVSSTSEIGANTSVEAIVFFVGCEPNRQGDCEVWGTATVVAPDGSFLADRIDVPLWVGRPPPPGRALGISEHGVGMRDESAPGTYVFRIVVTDRVSGREVSLEQSVAVVQ